MVVRRVIHRTKVLSSLSERFCCIVRACVRDDDLERRFCKVLNRTSKASAAPRRVIFRFDL